MGRKINIHLVSDSTGETLGSICRAVMSQFREVEYEEYIWSLIRSESQIERVVNSIIENPGIVIYTILKNDFEDKIKKICRENNIPCISALGWIIEEFSKYLGIDVAHQIGRQHKLDNEYFSRVEAMNYTIMHDDGQSHWDLDEADIVLIGVSRTSKSPTSIYLSCRGYKTANVPFVSEELLPESIYVLKNPLVVGLIIDPEKLVHIRKHRINSIGDRGNFDYVDIDRIKDEIFRCRKVLEKLKAPIIDVTKSSVEESAAKIIQLYQDRKRLNDER